jgi:hypothetical protein
MAAIALQIQQFLDTGTHEYVMADCRCGPRVEAV